MGFWDDLWWEVSTSVTDAVGKAASKVDDGFRKVDRAVTSGIDTIGDIEDSAREGFDNLLDTIGEEGFKAIESADEAFIRTGDNAVESISCYLDKLEDNPLEAFKLLGGAIAVGGAVVAAPSLTALLASRGASIPAGLLAGGVVGSQVADKLIGSSLMDPVDEPEIGGVVICDLLTGVAEHSGIYVGNGRIIHLDGSGCIEEVSRQEFLARLGGGATAMNIYTSCMGDMPVGSPMAASLAKSALGSSRSYSFLMDNCHQFTAGCITGDFENADNFLWFLEMTAERDFGMDGWRVWRPARR